MAGVNPQDVQAVTETLAGTLNAHTETRLAAEQFLRSSMASPTLAPLLITVMQSPDVDESIRLQAAIQFKLYIKRNWDVVNAGGDVAVLHDEMRVFIKDSIVDMMVRQPEKIQNQLSDAIAIIGKYDFPHAWESLMPHMAAQFLTGDFNVINGVLRTAHPLFKKYRFAFRSDELWLEIKAVLEHMALPITTLFTTTIHYTQEQAGNAESLRLLYDSLLLICKIFYSLNFQDLPEVFEDNMPKWMEGFQLLLRMPEDPSIAATAAADQPSIMDQIKSQICENISLYAQKYEEFGTYIQPFVMGIWELLVSLGAETRYDPTVCNAMQFLTSVAEKPYYKAIFGAEGVLQSLCEKVIVPNMKFRELEEEIFESDSEEYIRRDIEGSDLDTRRRGACDLVRGLCAHWEPEVTAIFTGYIGYLLQDYAAAPASNWHSKDAAVFLVTSLAVRGRVQGKGATSTNELVNVLDFYHNHILPDLQTADVNQLPVLKADALKFIMTFRSQMSKDLLMVVIPLVIQHLQAESSVVVSYAAGVLEKTLCVRTAAGPMFTEAEVGAWAGDLLTNLFGALNGNPENEYIMKAIMRTIAAAKGAIMPLAQIVTGALNGVLMQVAKNPSKPRFNHFLFEAIGSSVRYCCPGNPAALEMFEAELFPPFEALLQGEVLEFQPYVFQILSQLLESRESGVPPPYMQLYPLLLTASLWESSANASPLVRLLRAYLAKGGAAMVADAVTLEGLLAIFVKLISNRATDLEGFHLLGSIVEVVPASALNPYLASVLSACFMRLSKSKTAKFVRGMMVFVCLLAGTYGGDFVVTAVEQVQAGLFSMLMNRLTEDVRAVFGEVEQKTVAVGLTKFLTETPALLGPFAPLWPRIMLSLSVLGSSKETSEVEDEEHVLDELENTGYQASFVNLAFSGRHENDPFPAVANFYVHVAHHLHAACAALPGQLVANIPQEAFPFVQECLAAAGLPQLP